MGMIANQMLADALTLLFSAYRPDSRRAGRPPKEERSEPGKEGRTGAARREDEHAV